MGEPALKLVPPAPPRVQSADARRFYELVVWFRRIGVCGHCGLDGAIAMVEREAGRATAPPEERVCVYADRRGRTCRQLAELHWNERPRPTRPTATKGTP